MSAVRRRSLALGLAVGTIALAGAPPALALVDRGGTTIPNTATSGTAAQLAAGPTLTKKLFTPESPGDDDPAVLATLGSSATPEDDLGAALDALRDAASANDAQDARRRALDILEGNPVPDRTYSGMPLLSWDAPRKVKDVPPGGEVRVREVRYGDTVLSDTWLLRFADPDQSFTVRYEITELGPAMPGELAPTPLLADAGGPVGGVHSVLEPLAIAPVPTGTSVTSRFISQLGDSSRGKEQTRQGVQEITVRMPPPRYVDAILDPDLVAHGDPMAAGGNPISAVRPLSAARLARAEHDFGFSGGAPTDAQRAAAIAKLGARAPEHELYTALQGLDASNLTAAHAVGTDDRQLVSAMRVHSALPPGFAGDPTADASLVLVNGEAYRSRDVVRVAPGGSLTVSVTNGDAYPRTISATQLFADKPVLGAVDWGQFNFGAVDLGAAATLAPGESHTFTIRPEGDAFELVVADPDHGEQGTWALRLDRGPLKQSLAFDPNFTAPLHITQGADGEMWMTLAGVDEIGRMTPAANLGDSKMEHFLLPGGNHNQDPNIAPLGPHALKFDARGILWATLDAGSAIARIDPAKVKDGTEDGIRVYKLDDCTQAVCPDPFPPEPGPPPPRTRMPVQMDLSQDGTGDTVLAFAEENASSVGVMRFAPDGTELDQTHISCHCVVPLGLAMGADGSIWFTKAVENMVGHLTLDQAEPFKAAAAKLDDYKIPSGILQADPALVPSGATFFSSVPHSLAIDRHGNVWFSEEAMSKVGMLDPAKATPGTTDGMTEVTLKRNDFGRDPSPADISIDRQDTLFWADEYGDAIGSLKPTGEQLLFRPAERNSLTDAPMTDSDGNLWFMEGGAALLTRISGVSAGTPRPQAPPTLVARTATGTLSVQGADRFPSLTADVLRDGQVVRSADLALDGGAASADLGLQAGDRVRITPHGHDATAPFTFTVATLQARLLEDGLLMGEAMSGGSALAGQVAVTTKDGEHAANINPATGSFSAADAPAAGQLTWSQGTPAGVFRTITPYGSAGAADPGPSVQPPAEQPRGGDGRSDAPKPRPADPCADRVWMVRHGNARRVPLLGLTARKVTSCLGRPTSRLRRGTTERWRYGKGVELKLVAGKVTQLTLRDGRFSSAPDGLAVGASSTAVARALGRQALAARRAVLRRGDGRYSDVRLSMKGSRVSGITVMLQTWSALDHAGRRLAGRRG